MTRALVYTALTLIVLCVLPGAEAQAHPAWGIAVDPQGQVYFSDLKRVWKIDAQGRLTLIRPEGERHTHDLTVDEAGNLYGADNSYEPSTQRFFGALWRLTPAGQFSYLLASTDDIPEGMSIYRDRDGNMYHIGFYKDKELLVLKRAPDGKVTPLVGSPNWVREYRQGSPHSLGGTAFGPDGALYFTHGPNVSKVTMAGEFTPLARDITIEKAYGDRSAGAPTPLFGITVDAQGNVFVADHGNRRVLKIRPDGQRVPLISAEEQWFPTGVASRGGDLYILEQGETPSHRPLGARVRKLSPDGRITTLATVDENGAPSSTPPTANNASTEGSAGPVGHNQAIRYALVGTGLSVIIALTIIAWRVWRRRYNGQPGSV